MKKLLNDPRHVVREMLEGLADVTPGLALLADADVAVRADLADRRQVALISGGGAGHEPAHAGYVGAGMLHAAMVGDVFTSPSVDAVLAAIQAVAGPSGVVLVVKSGGRRPRSAPWASRWVPAPSPPPASQASPWASRRSNSALASTASRACSEAGCGRRMKWWRSCWGQSSPFGTSSPATGSRCWSMAWAARRRWNWRVVTRAAMAALRERRITVERAWTGTFLSALEMPGCSLSLLSVDDATLRLLDAPTTAPAWPGDGIVPLSRKIRSADIATLSAAEKHRSHDTAGPAVLRAAVACAAALQSQERRLTELDSAAGDGDLGISMARGAAAIQALPEHQADAAGALTQIATALRRAVGGSSGPFYAVGLLRAAQHIAGCGSLDAAAWATAFEHAVDAVAELGGARPGDRTMLDALYPAVQVFKAALDRGATAADALAECAAAAAAGTAATARMRPRLGRASYLGDRALGTEDAGAAAVSIWLRALAEARR